ncbi:MAG: hypothetical protein Q9222_002093 [Ikaeria aurantiellina]
MQLRNGKHSETGSTQDEELAIMVDLYSSLNPPVRRTPPKDLMRAVEVVSVDTNLLEEQRLIHLHRMLELCTLEHESEVEAYQQAHLRLVEHEGDMRTMVAYPKMPDNVFELWESWISGSMSHERLQMKKSRKNTKALLAAIKYAEEQVRKTQKTVSAQGKHDRFLREMERSIDEHITRMSINSEAAEQTTADAVEWFSRLPDEQRLPENLDKDTM